MEFSRKRFFALSILILLLAASWKIILLAWGKFPFNSDEAIIALMGRHILAGARPVFFYGQMYMGSLDAWLVAAGFAVFGQFVWVIRLVQTLLFLGVITTGMWITWLLTGNRFSCLVTGLLLALPTVNVSLYTTVSLGGYNEALFIGNIVLVFSILIFRKVKERRYGRRLAGFVLLWGFFSGLGLWANALSLIYVVPGLVYMLSGVFSTGLPHMIKKLVPAGFTIALCGFLAGSAPFWMHGFQNGWSSLLNELLGSAVAVESTGIVIRSLNHMRNFLLLGLPVLLGLRPPWEIRWLIAPLLPLVLSAWIWLGWAYKKQHTIRPSDSMLLAGTALMLIGAFIFTSFGIDPSGRYFLPLYVLAAVMGGSALTGKSHVLQYLVPGLIIAFNFASTIQCALHDPPALTTQFYAPAIVDHRYDQELIDFLIDENQYYGYTNYWVSYPLAFLSGEKLIYLPRLPYHLDMRYTERDDRYAPYRQIVAQNKNSAYITTNHPDLNVYIRSEFEKQGVSWNEKVIGSYTVFYNLSKTIRPTDIGLGQSQ